MARTMFENEELRNQLFMEIVKPAEGHITIFHGFFTDEALLRSRKAREVSIMLAQYNNRTLSMADYLYFLAELFADIERQQRPTNRVRPPDETIPPFKKGPLPEPKKSDYREGDDPEPNPVDKL